MAGRGARSGWDGPQRAGRSGRWIGRFPAGRRDSIEGVADSRDGWPRAGWAGGGYAWVEWSRATGCGRPVGPQPRGAGVSGPGPGGLVGRLALRRASARLRQRPARGEGPASVRPDEPDGRADLDPQPPGLLRLHQRQGERRGGAPRQDGGDRGRDGHPQLRGPEGDDPVRDRPQRRSGGRGRSQRRLDDPERHRPEPRRPRLRHDQPGPVADPVPDDRPRRPARLADRQDGLRQQGPWRDPRRDRPRLAGW